MKYQKNYYYFKSALSNVLCDKIIKEGMSNNQKSAGVGYIDPKTKFELEEVKKKRDSNISWIGDVWLKRLLKPLKEILHLKDLHLVYFLKLPEYLN